MVTDLWSVTSISHVEGDSEMVSIKSAVLTILLSATIAPVGSHGIPERIVQLIDSDEASIQGKVAPDFELKTMDGTILRLSELRGKAVVLNFWATWCEPCMDEMPVLVELQKKYGSKGLQVIGINGDSEDPAKLKELSVRLKLNFPLVQGNESVSAAYGGVELLPTTFFVDREGRFMARTFGLRSRRTIESKVRATLGLH